MSIGVSTPQTHCWLGLEVTNSQSVLHESGPVKFWCVRDREERERLGGGGKYNSKLFLKIMQSHAELQLFVLQT